MQYSIGQISSIKGKIISKIDREIDLSIENGNLEEVLDKYGIYLEEDIIPVNTRTMKILVFGALAGNLHEYQKASKLTGIDPDHIEFINDYERLGRYDIGRLEYSMSYSDIIYGPVPHSQVGKGSFASGLSRMKDNPDKYPRIIEAVANNSLKITITNFKEALLRTRYFENME